MPPKSTAWPAPTTRGPVDATVTVPGSKSVTNRALVLAARADGPSVVRRPLRARDTELMVAALRALGVGVDDTAKGHWAVTPPKRLTGPAHVDCGLAGTVMRFVPPVAALAKGDVRFDGDPRARVRPMAGIIGALEAFGVRIDDDGRGTLPFTVRGTGRVSGGTVELDASSSSQFISALLLASPRFEQGALIRHRGRKLPSMPHIAMSVAMLREQGVVVTESVSDPSDCSWEVRPGPIRAVDRRVEPDLSNAAPFLAAAMVTGGTVRIPGWPRSTTQAGDALRDLLVQFGGRVTLDDDGLTVRGPARMDGVDADLRDVGELTPVLAAMAALASTPSRLRGIGHLRGHETDRLAALATEINRLGGDVGEKSNGLRIRPRPLHGGVVETYDDHRMATAAAVLGLVVPGILVRDVATTAKTLPGFVDMWRDMLGRDEETVPA